MSIASFAIAEEPVVPMASRTEQAPVPAKRRTVAMADAPLVPQAE